MSPSAGGSRPAGALRVPPAQSPPAPGRGCGSLRVSPPPPPPPSSSSASAAGGAGGPVPGLAETVSLRPPAWHRPPPRGSQPTSRRASCAPDPLGGGRGVCGAWPGQWGTPLGGTQRGSVGAGRRAQNPPVGAQLRVCAHPRSRVEPGQNLTRGDPGDETGGSVPPGPASPSAPRRDPHRPSRGDSSSPAVIRHEAAQWPPAPRAETGEPPGK